MFCKCVSSEFVAHHDLAHLQALRIPLNSYFEFMKPTGILKPGTNPCEGIFNDSRNPEEYEGIGGRLATDEKKRELLTLAHQIPEYLAFSPHPTLRAFVRKFMGWAEDVEAKRTILRHNVPHSMSTAIHYDKIFLRAGDAYPLTAWVPIGDCAANGGGLMYLENSTELGQDMEDSFTERAQVLPPEERVNAYNVNMHSSGCLGNNAQDFGRNEGQGKKWLTAEYEAGDVVFHNPYLLHASGMNEDSLGRIRLSTDLRFYEKGAPGIDERWMQGFWFPG